MKYRVGVAQFQPNLFEVDENLNKMNQLLKGIKADLVVFPELATSGYVFGSKEEVRSVAEDAYTGKTALLFSRLAKANNCSYVVGFVELNDDKLYNSSMLINPDGKIFVYRKTHLFYEEKLFFEPGDSGLNVFEAKAGVKVGLMICFDWIFPEAARTLALKGAQIITHSANLVLPWCQQAMITRSLENRIFSITSNRTGEEINGDKKQFFTGMSQILTTKGEIIHRMNQTEESIYITEIDPTLADDKTITEYNDAFGDRRLDFYK
ncbi:MAG: beta-ureidopropionase [Candidatus Cloacimonetes bacterium]|nr:beta-ureidopropionase [Candidatus Cloacimonadota bacterium]